MIMKQEAHFQAHVRVLSNGFMGLSEFICCPYVDMILCQLVDSDCTMAQDKERMDGWMDGWMGKWIYLWMDVWMDDWMDGFKTE